VTGLAEVLAGPSLEVAPLLLGARLTNRTADGTVTVRLTEVEAYAGEDDPGSHGFRGPTRRNEVMFGPAGRLYVYFTYGMHYCCNVVCGATGEASAVLLRAGEVVEGHELARLRRSGVRDRELARGPARLCSALGIDAAGNGHDLSRPPLTLALPSAAAPADAVSTGPRVGLRGAADRPWRFWLTGDPSVSTYRPAAPLRSARRR
jgi:DNA-3-methyladenine glycosylase